MNAPEVTNCIESEHRTPPRIWWTFDGERWSIHMQQTTTFSGRFQCEDPPTNAQCKEWQEALAKLSDVLDEAHAPIMRDFSQQLSELYNGPAEETEDE